MQMYIMLDSNEFKKKIENVQFKFKFKVHFN